MEQYLIDTNVVSDYFSASLPPDGLAFLDVTIDAVPNLSIITQIELLCWKTDASTEQGIKDFIADSNILNITPEVVAASVRLRKGKKLKPPMPLLRPPHWLAVIHLSPTTKKILPTSRA